MHFKALLKTISLGFFSTLVLANDCDKIKSYLNKRGDSYEKNIEKCSTNSAGYVTTLEISNYSLDEDELNKILSYKSIKNLNYYCGIFETTYGVEFSAYEDFPSIIANLPNLEELTLSYAGLREYARGNIRKGVLKTTNNLKKLTLSGIQVSPDNVNDIATLTNLEELNILGGVRENVNMNFDELKSLTKLKTLKISRFHHYELTEIPNFVFSLPDLRNLVIIGQHIATIPDKLSTLKNLEYLDLSFNEINSELPNSLNSLTNLKYVDFKSNVNVKGKTLTNESLRECYYESNYDLCKAKEMSCFGDYVTLKSCSSGTIGKCGDGIGRCPDGQCCSKYGWCGVSEKYCELSNGCQTAYGKCNGVSNNNTSSYSTTGKCGPNDGICQYGQCCSKYGWCGTSEKHCLISNGCQSEFGNCSDTLKVSSNSQCGKKIGKCPAGQCCSKYGWCGTTEKHCSVEQGCQSEFGDCKKTIVIPTSTNGRCGEENGICPNSKCCSKYGWCGTTDAYCGSGCQSEFGKCK